MKILLTGSNGYIGESLKTAFKKKYNITAITRLDLNLTDRFAVAKWFENKIFDVVIHSAVVGGNRLKIDTSEVLDQNLEMYYNLLSHKDKFNKLIHFGSGAELSLKHTPYGLSKAVIANSIEGIENFFNIRIFAVFNENEEPRRFIKNSIINYKNKKNIFIHENKKMDFFYMKDFIKLIEHYIVNNNLPKIIDCTYKRTYTLLEIANMINNLDNHKSKIIIDKNINGQDYSGTHTPLLEYYGLEKGIKEVYKHLTL